MNAKIIFIISILVLSGIVFSLDITKTLKPFHNHTEGVGCSHIPTSKPSPATPIGSGLASENCTNAGQTLELYEIQYNATRFSDNAKTMNTAIDPIYPTFIFGFNFTGSYTGTLTNITVLIEMDATSDVHGGIRTYIYNFTQNAWYRINETSATTTEYTVVFNISDYKTQNRTTAGGTEIFIQVQVNKTSAGSGSPMIRDNNAKFWCETNSYSILKSMEEWDQCYMETKDFFFIEETFEDEEAYINNLEVYELSNPVQNGYDYVFEGRMKLEKIDDISSIFWSNVDWKTTNILLSLPFVKEIMNPFERMEKELAVFYNGKAIRVKGNPLNENEFQTYRITYKEGEILKYNGNLIEIRNERIEPHYDYKMEKVKTDFSPFTIKNGRKKINIESNNSEFLVKITAWYKPNKFIKEVDAIQSLKYFWNAYNDPEYFTRIINEHQSLQIDRIYANFTYTQGTDTGKPSVSFLSPLNNSVFFINESVPFNFNFTDLGGIVLNCSIWINNIQNHSTTKLGDSYIMDSYFNHTIPITFSQLGIGINWSVGCYDNSANLGTTATNWTINITNQRLEISQIIQVGNPSNSTINTTLNASGTVLCKDNECGRIIMTLRYNQSSEPDNAINNTFPLTIINTTGFPIYDVLFQNSTFLYEGAEWNGTHLWVINVSNKLIEAWNISNLSSPTKTVSFSIPDTCSAGIYCGAIGWDFVTNSVWYPNGTHYVNRAVNGDPIKACEISKNAVRMDFMAWADGFIYGQNLSKVIKINTTDCTIVGNFSLSPVCTNDCHSLAYINENFWIEGTSVGKYAVFNKTFSKIFILSEYYSDHPPLRNLGGSAFDGIHLLDINPNNFPLQGDTVGLTVRNIFNPVICNVNANLLVGQTCIVNWTANTSSNTGSHLIDVLMESNHTTRNNDLIISNNTVNIEINHTLSVGIVDSCTYSSGNWIVNCADNCLITSNVNLNGNDFLITGVGRFVTQAIISGINRAFSSGTGTEEANLCIVRTEGAGAFIK